MSPISGFELECVIRGLVEVGHSHPPLHVEQILGYDDLCSQNVH